MPRPDLEKLKLCFLLENFCQNDKQGWEFKHGWIIFTVIGAIFLQAFSTKTFGKEIPFSPVVLLWPKYHTEMFTRNFSFWLHPFHEESFEVTLVIYFPTQVLTLLFVVGKTCSIKFDYPSMRCDGKMTQKGALTLQFLIYLLCDLSS